jgi:hypothetical protein
MKDVGKCYDRLVYFTAISYILWPFGIFCGCCAIFFQFWYVVPRKIWQPWTNVCLFAAPTAEIIWKHKNYMACFKGAGCASGISFCSPNGVLRCLVEV